MLRCEWCWCWCQCTQLNECLTQAVLQFLATPVVHTCHLECKEMLAAINTDSTGGSSIKLGADTVAVSSEVHEFSLVHCPILHGLVSKMYKTLCVL